MPINGTVLNYIPLHPCIQSILTFFLPTMNTCLGTTFLPYYSRESLSLRAKTSSISNFLTRSTVALWYVKKRKIIQIEGRVLFIVQLLGCIFLAELSCLFSSQNNTTFTLTKAKLYPLLSAAVVDIDNDISPMVMWDCGDMELQQVSHFNNLTLLY